MFLTIIVFINLASLILTYYLVTKSIEIYRHNTIIANSKLSFISFKKLPYIYASVIIIITISSILFVLNSGLHE